MKIVATKLSLKRIYIYKTNQNKHKHAAQTKTNKQHFERESTLIWFAIKNSYICK